MYTIVQNFLGGKERRSWSYSKPRMGKSRLAKSDECRAYQEEITLQLRHIPEWVSEATSACRVTVLMVQDEDEWFTNSGELRIIDTTNIWKPTEDAIFGHFQINDSRAVDTRLIKVVREPGDTVSPDAPFELICALDLYGYEHRIEEIASKEKLDVNSIVRG